MQIYSEKWNSIDRRNKSNQRMQTFSDKWNSIVPEDQNPIFIILLVIDLYFQNLSMNYR